MTVLPSRDDTGADHPALAAAWRDRRRGGLSSYPVLTPAGLVLGTGTLLAKRLKDAWAPQALDFDADRLLALLAIAYDRPYTAEQARRILAKVQAAGRALAVGEPVQAAIHLAHAGLGVLPDADNAARRLLLAEMLLDQGMTPDALMKAAGFPMVKYSPDQPRDNHGRWTAADAGGDSSAGSGPRFLVSPDPEDGGLSRTLAVRGAVATAAAPGKQWQQHWLKTPQPGLLDKLAGSEQSANGHAESYGYDAFYPGTGKHPDPAYGRYQIKETTLIALGAKSGKGKDAWDTEFGRKYNIKTDDDFLNSEEAQDEQGINLINKIVKESAPLYKKYGGRTFIGIKGEAIKVTQAGLIGAFHRVGGAAVRAYFARYDGRDTKPYRNKILADADNKHAKGRLDAKVETRLREFQDVPYNDEN
ncbi:hypothetical protein FBZ87_101327 [Nitrospirillum amazonense]|uniref:Uncharacterized protein n=1 Tax=Nitrospirillum amazonense TaxID=28077 RepID=A0A560KHP3_9PROT|nr:hypothetical protein [Nitrospirillum amazonense]TWB82619.1 hypothetical protein FBZ87_101327 [Nitrospirillum amazonense]